MIESPSPPFFWLHIKKAGGMSIRSMLHPYYVEVDRTKRPPCFIQASSAEYNDILNNYRTVLGAYQFRRALFAKTYLYPDHWNRILTFAFVREPMSRAISMFYYLYWGAFSRRLRHMRRYGRAAFTVRQTFDLFLDSIEEFRASDSNFYRGDLHFPTHTASVWDDVTDGAGKLLISRIYRLDCLVPAINEVLGECGLPAYTADPVLKNRSGPHEYSPTFTQQRRIRDLFAHDFELYESAISLENR